ncbi:MAG: GNAT family N-acetyltransferase [Alphaproteobacteria bacterium]|nr:GNAT family N-acetyltransferase [Alphaproteobacteria bacterium]
MFTLSNTTFQIIEEDEGLSDAQQRLIKALSLESGDLRGARPIQEKCFSIVNQREVWIGGIAGYTLYGSLLIDILWINKDHRREGYGRKLVRKFEEWGKREGAAFVKISTMEWWDAVPFYTSLGYKVIFVDEGYFKGAKQYTLKKALYE